MDSQELADLIAADLEPVVERARVAYLSRVPRLREVPPATFEGVLEATRRTMALFCRYYLDGTLHSEAWRAARDATVERAGELFTHAEILEIIDIARSVGAQTIEDLGNRHPELTDEERVRVTAAMDRYVAELAQQEDRLRRLATPGRLDDVLHALELEGADVR